MMSAILSSARLRVWGVVRPHVSKAVSAASTARSTSAGPEAGTCATTSPSAGFSTSSVSPDAASTHWPPMNCWYVLTRFEGLGHRGLHRARRRAHLPRIRMWSGDCAPLGALAAPARDRPRRDARRPGTGPIRWWSTRNDGRRVRAWIGPPERFGVPDGVHVVGLFGGAIVLAAIGLAALLGAVGPGSTPPCSWRALAALTVASGCGRDPAPAPAHVRVGPRARHARGQRVRDAPEGPRRARPRRRLPRHADPRGRRTAVASPT